MSDLTIPRIKLAAKLLDKRTFDDADLDDEIFRQAAVAIRKDGEAIHQLRSRVAELEAAITKYGRHDLGCERNSFPTKISEFEIKRRPCTCGLSDLIKEQGDE
jgi:hypothetical protein